MAGNRSREKMNKGYTKRMGDKENIPEMNGTIKTLVSLIATPLETQEQQAQAIRDSIKLQLHTYMMQKQMLESLTALVDERKNIIARLIDKGLVPFLYFIAMAIMWIVFNTFKP
jgi:predicted transcriptional regulator YheO